MTLSIVVIVYTLAENQLIQKGFHPFSWHRTQYVVTTIGFGQKNVLPVFSTHCYIYVCSQRAGGAAKDQPEGAGAGRRCGLGQDRRAVEGLLRSRHYQRVQVGHLCSSPSFKPLLMFTVVSIRSRCCKG